MKSWSEMFPNGRDVFYDGDNPKEFVKEMKEKFGFDPSENNNKWNKKSGYQFFCPAANMENVYGSGKYRLGS